MRSGTCLEDWPQNPPRFVSLLQRLLRPHPPDNLMLHLLIYEVTMGVHDRFLLGLKHRHSWVMREGWIKAPIQHPWVDSIIPLSMTCPNIKFDALDDYIKQDCLVLGNRCQMKVRLEFGTEKIIPNFRDRCEGLHLKCYHL